MVRLIITLFFGYFSLTNLFALGTSLLSKRYITTLGFMLVSTFITSLLLTLFTIVITPIYYWSVTLYKFNRLPFVQRIYTIYESLLTTVKQKEAEILSIIGALMLIYFIATPIPIEESSHALKIVTLTALVWMFYLFASYKLEQQKKEELRFKILKYETAGVKVR